MKAQPGSKDWWDKFDISAKAAIALATLLWTVLAGWFLYGREERVASAQAQAAIEARELQRKSAAAQLVPALIPSLTKGSETERRIAFEALASVAPELLEKISSLVAETAATPADRHFAMATSKITTQAQANSAFLQHLANARVYQRYELYGQADRAYLSAIEHIPSGVDVDRGEIDHSKWAYTAGRFEEAAKRFETAFQRISTQ